MPQRESKRPFTLLVAGGSQGARSINTAVVDMLPHVDEPGSLQLIHQCGSDDLDRIRQAYATAGIPARVEAFFSDMDRQYAQADLVICRAGATTRRSSGLRFSVSISRSMRSMVDLPTRPSAYSEV